MESEVIILLLLAIMAFLYASVGHGGASGYLAVMAIFNISPNIMKPSALMLNILVSLCSFIILLSGRIFSLKTFFTFCHWGYNPVIYRGIDTH